MYELHHGDCLEVMASMEANSVDAIVTDPPYFRVKNEPWDRQWSKPEGFLDWLGDVLEQMHRVLRPNGSLYLFASPQMRARAEIKVGEYFNTLPTITWAKHSGAGNGQWSRASKEGLRSYFPRTEAIIFAEHYGADNIVKGEAGYVAKCDELRGFIFEPLRAYLRGEVKRAGLTREQVRVGFAEALGTKGKISGHYFDRAQWELPTRDHYELLRSILNQSGGNYLKREYESLRIEYDDLKAEYEHLRRPFHVTPDVPYTDVWEFATVQSYKGKHPCEKPQDMLRHILAASTRPGAVVLDPFAGSGSLGEAAIGLGRHPVLIEMSDEWCGRIRDRLDPLTPETEREGTTERVARPPTESMPGLFAGM